MAVEGMDEKEKLINSVKKQVKILMEEAVAKKYIYEDSSSVLALCALIDNCLALGLKRRAIGLFRTNTSTALLHKIAKKSGGPAAELIAKLHELDASIAAAPAASAKQPIQFSSCNSPQNSHGTSGTLSTYGTTGSSKSVYWSSSSNLTQNSSLTNSSTPPSKFTRRIFPFARIITDAASPKLESKSATTTDSGISGNATAVASTNNCSRSNNLYKTALMHSSTASSSTNSSSLGSPFSTNSSPSSQVPHRYHPSSTTSSSSSQSSTSGGPYSPYPPNIQQTSPLAIPYTSPNQAPIATTISPRFKWLRVALTNRQLIPVLEQIIDQGQDYYDKKTAIITDPLLSQLLCSLLIGPTCALEYTNKCYLIRGKSYKNHQTGSSKQSSTMSEYTGFGNDLPAAQELIRRHRLKRLRQQRYYQNHQHEKPNAPMCSMFSSNTSIPPLPSASSSGSLLAFRHCTALDSSAALSLESAREFVEDSLYYQHNYGPDVSSVLLYGKNNVIVYQPEAHASDAIDPVKALEALEVGSEEDKGPDRATSNGINPHGSDSFTGYLSLHRKTILHSGINSKLETDKTDLSTRVDNNSFGTRHPYEYETANQNRYESILCLKWTPNQLMNNDIIDEGYDEDPLVMDSSLMPADNHNLDRLDHLVDVDGSHQRRPQSNEPNSMPPNHHIDPKKLIELALTINVQDILYLHCHRKSNDNDSLILVRHDGIPIPPLIFPKGNHLLTFLSCLENALAPKLKLDPPLWDHELKGKVFPKFSQAKEKNGSQAKAETTNKLSDKFMIKMNSASKLPRSPFFFGIKNTSEDGGKRSILNRMKSPRSLDSIAYTEDKCEDGFDISGMHSGTDGANNHLMQDSFDTDFDYIFRIMSTTDEKPISSPKPSLTNISSQLFKSTPSSNDTKESALTSTYAKLKKTSKLLENYFVYPSVDLIQTGSPPSGSQHSIDASKLKSVQGNLTSPRKHRLADITPSTLAEESGSQSFDTIETRCKSDAPTSSNVTDMPLKYREKEEVDIGQPAEMLSGAVTSYNRNNCSSPETFRFKSDDSFKTSDHDDDDKLRLQSKASSPARGLPTKKFTNSANSWLLLKNEPLFLRVNSQEDVRKASPLSKMSQYITETSSIRAKEKRDNHVDGNGSQPQQVDKTVERPITNDSMQLLCETVKKQIILRTFCGWLEFTRHVKQIRAKIDQFTLPWCTFEKYLEKENLCQNGLTEILYDSILEQGTEKITDSDLLLISVYINGIENNYLRSKVWPFLLGYYYFSSTADERDELYTLSKQLYDKNYGEWSKLESFVRQRDKEIAAEQLQKLANKVAHTTHEGAIKTCEVDNVYDNEGFEIIDIDDIPTFNNNNETSTIPNKQISNSTCVTYNSPDDKISLDTADDLSVEGGNDCSSLFRKLSQASSIFGKRSSLTLYKAQRQQKQVPQSKPTPSKSSTLMSRQASTDNIKIGKLECSDLSISTNILPPTPLGTADSINKSRNRRLSSIRPGLGQILHHYPTPYSLSATSSNSSSSCSENVDDSSSPTLPTKNKTKFIFDDIPSPMEEVSKLNGDVVDPETEYSIENRNGSISSTDQVCKNQNKDSIKSQDDVTNGKDGSEETCTKEDYADEYITQFYPAEFIENFALNLHRIDKDVIRCDRNYWYFEESENLDKLKNVICSYVWKNLDTGYFQGMCDLAAPLLVIFNDEVLTYECFSKLMERMSPNFPSMGSAMDENFTNMASLIEILDPELHHLLLRSGEYSHFYFCYRWFLLDFKRELTYADVFWVWETIWAARFVVSEHFVLFLALAFIEYYRTIILENNMEFTDIIKFYNEMAEKHPVNDILELSKKLVKNLQQILS